MAIAYDPKSNPPQPILQIELGTAGQAQRIGHFSAIVDTGADASIVPQQIVNRLGATLLNPGSLKTPWGDSHPVSIYLLDILVNRLLLPANVVAGDPASTEIILGRNVLNKLTLFLDGPEQQTDLLDDATVKRLRRRRVG